MKMKINFLKYFPGQRRTYASSMLLFALLTFYGEWKTLLESVWDLVWHSPWRGKKKPQISKPVVIQKVSSTLKFIELLYKWPCKSIKEKSLLISAPTAFWSGFQDKHAAKCWLVSILQATEPRLQSLDLVFRERSHKIKTEWMEGELLKTAWVKESSGRAWLPSRS